jgi:hypothetical protein
MGKRFLSWLKYGNCATRLTTGHMRGQIDRLSAQVNELKAKELELKNEIALLKIQLKYKPPPDNKGL